MIKIENNETPDYCKGCGICCKRAAGWYSPHQVLVQLILLSKNKLDELGKTIQIDCYDGKPNIYVLRPVHLNSIGKDIDRSWGGTCVNFTETGCRLNFDKRPYECQALIATDYKVCSSNVNRKDISELWRPFQFYFESYFSKFDEDDI